MTTFWRGSDKRGAVAILWAALALAGCDFEITNPGPVQDENLDDPAAHVGLVNGAKRGVLTGFSMYAHQGAAVSREIQAAGSTGDLGITREVELAMLSQDDRHIWDAWTRTHKGRWIAEDAIARIERVMGAEAASYAPLAQAYLWAGVANRTLGESTCTAIFDAGGPEPYKNHFTRAIAQFTKAEQIAGAAGDQNTRTAVIAMRAAAHVFLGNWTAAAEDAAKVPLTFTYSALFQNRGTTDLTFDGERYRINSAMVSRDVSFWNTPAEENFLETGDPRLAWGFDPAVKGRAVRAAWGTLVPVYYPLKYYSPRATNERTLFLPNSTTVYSIPINLATGREMALIRAEAALVTRQAAGIPDALVLINSVRQRNNSYFTGQPLAAVTATTLEEAWSALKFERFAEMIMEGRRLGDRKRWAENKTPGALHPAEFMPANHVTRFGVPKEPPLCFPLPRVERERNTNIPADYQDPIIRG